MIRQIVVPTNTKQTIEFPEEFIGKQVEIIAFTIEEKVTDQVETKKAFDFWKANSIDMGNFKFDRDEANEC